MFRALKFIWLVPVLLLAGGQKSQAFSLLGPFEAYQTAVIGYRAAGDIGGPLNIGEQYRWNTKNLYWAVDANFYNFFGSNGLAAVEEAFAIMNNLSNVSSYTKDLSEWPTISSRINHRAEALGLSDLKSAILNMVIQELGLTTPDRYTWTLRTRAPGNNCPITAVYDVIQRNFDPVTAEPSSYVNGTLYTYTIIETCTGPNPLADAVEFQVDPAAEINTAVTATIPFAGLFFTGLTRDDVGGLRFLLQSNRTYLEPLEANTPSLLVDTNNSLSLLVTSNLADLIAAAPTNNAAQLAALFPGIQILNTVQLGFSNVVTANIVGVITSNPFGPPGNMVTVLTTNFTTNIIQVFRHTFGNVVTNRTYTQNRITVIQTNVTSNPFGPPGSLITNIVSSNIVATQPGGEFFLIPAAAQCGFSVISTQLTSVVATTNAITNIPGVTNAANVTFFTNHTLVVSIPNCITGNISLRQGIEKMRFFRRDFDSLLGQDWNPVTNVFTIKSVTNGQIVNQTVYRLVNQPDFLITARDIIPTLGVIQSISFNNTAVGTGLAGPGIIQPPVLFTLNKVGPIFQNPGPNGGFLPPFNESTHGLLIRWGSFSGTTNEPIAYPSGTSIVNLENNIFLQITLSGPLPVAHLGQPYSFQVPVAGAQPQPPFYSWSLVSLLPGVPPPSQPAPGLNLTSVNTAGVVISGIPTATGVFDFTLQVTDSAGRVSQATMSIEVDP